MISSRDLKLENTTNSIGKSNDDIKRENKLKELCQVMVAGVQQMQERINKSYTMLDECSTYEKFKSDTDYKGKNDKQIRVKKN